MRYLVKNFSKLFLSTVINAILGIVKNKFFALLLGTAGLGIAAQFINLNNFIVFIGGMGIPLGLIKYLSEYQEDTIETKHLIQESISVILLVSSVLIVFGALFSKELSLLILYSDSFGLSILFVLLSFPGILISAIFDAYLRAKKHFSLLVGINIINSVIFLVVSLGFVYFMGIEGVAIAILVSSIIALGIYIIGVLRVGEFGLQTFFRLRLKFSARLKNIFAIGIASFVSGGMQQLSLLSIRTVILKNLGADDSGIYQSVYLVSSNYLNLLIIAMSYYALPVLSGLKEQEHFNKELNSIYRLSNLIIIPIIIVVFAFRYQVFSLLFSSKFLSASDIMFYNSLGDFFRISSWVLSLWFIPKGKIKLFVFTEIIANLNFVLIFLMLLYFFNLKLQSVVIAYAIANLMQVVINYYFIRKGINFKLQLQNSKLFFISFGIILVVLIISQVNIWFGYIVVMPALVVWFFMNVSKYELTTLKDMVLERLRSSTNP